MKAKLSDWASIAEIVGAAAIVVSLLFVGVQVRESTKATQAATQQQGFGYELQILLAQNEISREGAVRLGVMTQDLDFSDTSKAELEANSLYVATLRLFEDQFLQHVAGNLSDAAWEARQPIMTGYANGPAMEEFLDAGFLQEDFIDFMRSLQGNQGR